MDPKAFAAEFTGDKPYRSAVAILQSPTANTSTNSCLTFDYFVRSSLTVSRFDLDPNNKVNQRKRKIKVKDHVSKQEGDLSESIQ